MKGWMRKSGVNKDERIFHIGEEKPKYMGNFRWNRAYLRKRRR